MAPKPLASELLLEEIASRARAATPRARTAPVETTAAPSAPTRPPPVVRDPTPVREVPSSPPMPEGEALPLTKFRGWTSADSEHQTETAVAAALADDEASRTGETAEDSDLAIRVLSHF